MTDQRKTIASCALPPALDDLSLIAAMDGETPSDMLAHLRVCSYCCEHIRELGALQNLLRRRLYRLFCPSSAELTAFHRGALTQAQTTQISEHLLSCPHCACELRLLTNMVTSVLHDEPVILV